MWSAENFAGGEPLVLTWICPRVWMSPMQQVISSRCDIVGWFPLRSPSSPLADTAGEQASWRGSLDARLSMFMQYDAQMVIGGPVYSSGCHDRTRISWLWFSKCVLFAHSRHLHLLSALFCLPLSCSSYGAHLAVSALRSGSGCSVGFPLHCPTLW